MPEYYNSQEGAYANEAFNPEQQAAGNPDQITFEEYMRRNASHPSNFGRPGQALTAMEHTTLAGILSKQGLGVSNPYRAVSRGGGGDTIPGGREETRASQLPPPPERSLAYNQQQNGSRPWRVGGQATPAPQVNAQPVPPRLPPAPAPMPIIRGASGTYKRPAAFTASATTVMPNPYQRQ